MKFDRSVVILCLHLVSSVLSANILAVFTHGHRSHLLLYSAVVRVLLQQRHNVTIISTRQLENLPDNGENLTSIHLKTFHRRTPPPAGSRLQASLDRIEQSSDFMEDPEWQRFMNDDNVGTFDIMILGYLFNDYLLGVAAHFHCPAVVVWPGPPIGYIHSLVGNPEERWYVTQPYDSQQRRGVKALVLGMFERIVEHMSFQVMERIYNQNFPAPEYPSFWSARSNVSLVFCNHYSPAEGPIAPYVPGLIEIGGLQNYVKDLEVSYDLRALAHNDDRPVIFLSFGTRVEWTSLPFAQNITHTFLEAFRQLPQFLVLWTYDGDCAALTANSTNVLCERWWPQSALLSHPRVKLFITHGGKSSISESLYNAVPILGIPFVGDQRPNIARLVVQGVALQLDPQTLSTHDLLLAISSLTQPNGSFEEVARKRAELYRDRPRTPNATLAYWIEYVIKHKGARHMRSPRMDLNMWQRNSIDIYAFIGAILACMIYAVKRIERWLEARDRLEYTTERG